MDSVDSDRAHRSRAPRLRRRSLAYAVLTAVVVVAGTATGTALVQAWAQNGAGAQGGARAVASPSPSAVSSPAPSSASEGASVEPEPAATSVNRTKSLADAMDSVAGAARGKVSVAVLALGSGESASYGDGSFDTASIVKVNILAALLLQAQDADRRLTAQERAYATTMIEDSDNEAATALWESIGRADGLDAANARLGLTATEGGDGVLWGLTQTTAEDQLTLLRQVFGTDEESELSEESRTYVQGLMGNIAAGQDWGVSAAGSAWALKNGWLPRTATGLWDINSVGRVTAAGEDYLVAVVSNGNADMKSGITVVEAAAKAAVRVMAAGE